VSSGSDEVEASVNPEVNLLVALGLLFLAHVCFVLVVNEINDRRPRIAIVDIVAKARRVDDGKLDLELLFLELSLNDLDFGKLVELLVVPPGVVLGRGQLSREKRVDQGSLPKTGLA
jgi:hypothetical protein